MIGIVNEIGKTQTGNPKIKIGEVWFYPGQTSVEGLVVGRTIEYTCAPFKTQNGKELMGLNSWKSAPDLPIAQIASQRASNGDTGHVLNEAEMRFVSNCVGSAITAGSCKSPADIKSWFLSAKAALKPVDEFDDEVPFE